MCKKVCSVEAGDVREGKAQEIMKQLKLAREAYMQISWVKKNEAVSREFKVNQYMSKPTFKKS